MRTLSPILAAVLLAAAPSAVTIGYAQAQTCTCPPRAAEAGQVRIIADEAPPPLPEYDQPPLPGPGYIWTPGYWAWNNDDYYFVPGTWVEPPHPGVLWTPGYWAFVGGAYMFHRGYWAPHVGFYGGVAYGYGYFGDGFEGGRWQGDHFYYNRTVNNFGSVHIVNVYEHPAPRIVERVSFNGGPDGVRARPTAEQIAAEKEKHIAPTVAQRRNVRAASHNEAAFVTNNQGKPPVAATQKPGEFKGAAVAPAKAAGGPIKARPLDEATPGRNEAEKVRPGAEKPEVRGEKPEIRGEKPELRGEKPEARKPDLRGEKPQAKPEAQKPDLRGQKPEAKPEVQKPEPRAEKPEAQKPEPKAEKPEAKPEAQRPEPKAEKPEARREKPEARPERREAKPEAKPEARRPEPRVEPKPEKPRAEAPRPRPAAEPRRAQPEPRREGGARPACHAGEAHCPK